MKFIKGGKYKELYFNKIVTFVGYEQNMYDVEVARFKVANNHYHTISKANYHKVVAINNHPNTEIFK